MVALILDTKPRPYMQANAVNTNSGNTILLILLVLAEIVSENLCVSLAKSSFFFINCFFPFYSKVYMENWIFLFTFLF